MFKYSLEHTVYSNKLISLNNNWDLVVLVDGYLQLSIHKADGLDF